MAGLQCLVLLQHWFHMHPLVMYSFLVFFAMQEPSLPDLINDQTFKKTL